MRWGANRTSDLIRGTTFADRLLDWFDTHGRTDLPWQQDATPYRVWVSEIMLQQTQVATVIPYYERFMRRFPDVQLLADADRDDVLGHWSGLGYYARARNLHEAAIVVRDDYSCRFPLTFDDVIALPGIGRSTAGAILALSRGERHAILDGNVKRVLARYHAVSGWPGMTAVQNELWTHADTHTPDVRVADYTQAIMDLGATVCTRSKPACDRCPFSADCAAHLSGRESEFPGRKKRKEKPLRSTYMVLAHFGGQVYLQRRPSAGIWGGLWSLPEVADREGLDGWCRSVLGSAPRDVLSWPTLRHSFSHFDLDIQPLEVRLAGASSKVADRQDERWYALHEPQSLGLAAPVRALIDQLKISGTTE